MIAVGQSVLRKEAWDKVSGAARYTADFTAPGLLHACLVPSPHAHARLDAVDVAAALAEPGVRAVVTGADCDLLCGEVLEDRPPLARGKVRYCGEPVAAVVADSEWAALRGARAVRIHCTPLPIVNGPSAALAPGAPLLHEGLGGYRVAQPPCLPEAGTNVADRAKLRKGDMDQGWAASEVVVEAYFTMPQMDHAAMETRAVRCEILPDGRVVLHASTQAPFEVQKMLAQYFHLDQGRVVVHAPFLGGAFGGKAPVQLELIAYLASRAVAGRLVKLCNPREQDIAGSPVGCGMEAKVRLGATRTGALRAAAMTYMMDIGAYTDSSPRIARAIASACTGPYNVPNVWCDVISCYTNHVYATALRSFGYMPFTFAVERGLDKLAAALGMDPMELRLRNAIAPGHRTPTHYKLTRSIIGSLPECITRVRAMIGWGAGRRSEEGPKVRAKGVSCFWKTSSSPPNAISAAIVAFNQDGSVNLSIGAVECGPGTKTTAAQILAEALGMDVDRVYVHMPVDTQVDPEHWKTVASMATFMVGRAVIEAAQDAVRQLKSIAGIVLKAPPEDLGVGGGRIFLRDDPDVYLDLKDIAHGYKYADGDSIGGQIIGRGCFMLRHLTPLDNETGRGMPGPSWTVGAQAVEVELDTTDFSYRILRVATVMDVGRVINPHGARGVVMGGVCQGLGYGSREGLLYDADGRVRNDQLRTYKLMRAGEEPEYLVDFVESPQVDAPYGARPLGEHGIIGVPAALANALTAAAGVDLDHLPVTPENIWRQKGAPAR